MGAGPGKSVEGSRVTVNFNFQFAPPPAVVVANLHWPPLSVKGETWTQLHNSGTGNLEGGARLPLLPPLVGSGSDLQTQLAISSLELPQLSKQ